jgi:hypothetical protein
MSSAVVVDARAEPWRRRLGPAAWMVLEEAVLMAESAGSGRLQAGVSERRLCQCLGIGREAARRALTDLVDAGLLVRRPARRDSSGRFVNGAYLVLPPAGLSVVGPPGHGLPATGPSGARPDATVTHAAGDESAVSTQQASLFPTDAKLHGVDPVAGERPPSDGQQSYGAKEPEGCKVVYRVHELAPPVRSATPSSRVRKGSWSC